MNVEDLAKKLDDTQKKFRNRCGPNYFLRLVHLELQADGSGAVIFTLTAKTDDMVDPEKWHPTIQKLFELPASEDTEVTRGFKNMVCGMTDLKKEVEFHKLEQLYAFLGDEEAIAKTIISVKPAELL